MTTQDELVGQTLVGRYRVVRRLGAGGLGEVFEVEHLLTHNRHALKILHSHKSVVPKAVTRLLREAGVAGRVRSDRLVTTLDVGQLEDGRQYLLMELLEGRSWHEALVVHGPYRPAEAVKLAIEVCEGLAALHAAGLIHRDLKPDNVFLHGPGGRETVKLLDFGFAKNLPGHQDEFGTLTSEGSVIGTPHYIAPEQASGRSDIGPAADQYALGVILYQSLTGQVPYPGRTAREVLPQVVQGSFAPILTLAPHVPPGLAATVERAMRLDPNERFESIEAFAHALAPFGDGAPAQPPMSGAAARQPAAGQRNPMLGRTVLALAIVLVLLVIAAGAAWGMYRILVMARSRPDEAALAVPPSELPAPGPDSAAGPARGDAGPATLAERSPSPAPDELRSLAAALPDELPGLVLVQEPQPWGTHGVTSTWERDAPGDDASVNFWVSSLHSRSGAFLHDAEPFELPGLYAREIPLRTFSVRVHAVHTGRTPDAEHAEVLIGDRYRVLVQCDGFEQEGIAYRLMGEIDLEALERLAAHPPAR